MKTYFMAWESDNKRGHLICDFDIQGDGEEVTPRQALREMINMVIEDFSEARIPIKGIVSATQFNLVG